MGVAIDSHPRPPGPNNGLPKKRAALYAPRAAKLPCNMAFCVALHGMLVQHLMVA
jgi:hypothetical protein